MGIGMTYLIGEMALLLAAAGVIGFIVGWGFRHMSSNNPSSREEELAIQVRRLEADRDELESRLRSAQEMVHLTGADQQQTFAGSVPLNNQPANQTVNGQQNSSALPGVGISEGLRSAGGENGEYPVSDLIGMDDYALQQLREIGIRTTHELLRETDSDTKLRLMATAIEKDVSQVRRWRSQSDLMRVPGINKNYAQLLIVVGVMSVDTLNEIKPADLQTKLAALNAEQSLVSDVPSIASVEGWVEYANPLSQLDLDG